MNKQELLDQVKADIVKNNVCSHLAQNAKNLVFGVGSPDADILFIGEAPGKNEDEQGEPFIGAAGKFLDEMLADNKLNRSQIYITNIVKYRPPNNRDPEPEEKKEFWGYLVKQINIIQPKVVVTLGRHSMVMFLPEQKISQIHGQPKRVNWDWENGNDNKGKLVVLPLYHPAAALYNGAMRETLKEDFTNIITTLNIINSPGYSHVSDSNQATRNSFSAGDVDTATSSSEKTASDKPGFNSENQDYTQAN